jgi:hypothetical protein
MLGVCTDPLNTPADPATLSQQTNFEWVRIVAQPNIEDYIANLKANNIKLALVIAQESGDIDYSYLEPDLVVIGNEPDIDGPSSWTMTQGDYLDLWYAKRSSYDCPALTAGAASGNVGWWDTVMSAIENCQGMDVHPYGKTPHQAAELVTAYQIHYRMMCHVLEWHRPEEEIDEFVAILGRDQQRILCWFCWSDANVDGFGLLDANGQPKPEFYHFKQELKVNVGEGILNKMAEKGDQPAQDSWFMTNPDGTASEMGVGRQGIYYATNVSGGWEVKFAPFE